MGECIACKCGSDEQMWRDHGAPACVCRDFDHIILGKGFKKCEFNETKRARLYQKRHSFDVKHYYNIWEYDLSDVAPNLGNPISYTLEITFENKDGVWCNLNFYGLPKETVLTQIDEMCEMLYQAMLKMNGNPATYEGADE